VPKWIQTGESWSEKQPRYKNLLGNQVTGNQVTGNQGKSGEIRGNQGKSGDSIWFLPAVKASLAK